MNNFPLQWHPQWLVYHHGEQGIVLINKTDMVWLPYEQFSGIEFINGDHSENDIGLLLAQSQAPSKGAMFWYQLPKLFQSDLVTNNPNFQTLYKIPSASEASLLCETEHIEVLSLSDNSLSWLQGLAEILMEALVGNDSFAQSIIFKSQSVGSHQCVFANKLAVLLVDDFLSEHIAAQVTALSDDFHQVMIVEVVAPELAFTPCFIKNDFAQVWPKLTARLWENQPVRRAMLNLYPEQPSSFSVLQFDVPLSEQLNYWLVQYLAKHCQDNVDGILYVDLVAFEQINQDEVTNHTGLTKATITFTDRQSDQFAEQLEAPVVLNACMSVYDCDGGSRAMTPEQTVNRLLSLVNDKTGVVTHLEAFEEHPKNPIKIYRTAFYKTPTARQCEYFESDLFTQTCLGKGVSSVQSQASALCETIERYNAHFRDDVYLLNKCQSQLETFAVCIGYDELLPYSPSQFEKFADANHSDSKLKQAAMAYDDSPVHWLPVWSLNTSQKIYVPLSLCFSQIPFNDERFGRWSSNGCAAGNRLEEAILQGLLELIERDAVAIWWYNRSVRNAFDLSRLEQDNLEKLDASLALTHHYWVLDITTDIGVPAMVAIGIDKVSGGYILGMGCHINPELAAQRALTELCQLIPIRDQNGAPFDFDAIEKGDYLYPENELCVSDIEQICHDKDIRQQINHVVRALAQLNLDTMVLNYSRAHVPLATAKVFVPGLCHIWPQLGNPRLYQTPVRLGLISQALTEQQLNPLPLYI